MADWAAAVAVPFIVEAVKGLCNLIIEKHYKKKESTNQAVDAKDTEKLKPELKKDLEDLSFKVSLFEGIMSCAADKPVQDPPVQRWLEQLKDVLYDAEDLLDEYATDIAIQEMEERCVEERVDAAAAVTTERVKRGLKAKVREKAGSLFRRTKNNSQENRDNRIDNISESVDTTDQKQLSNLSNKVKDIISKLDDLEKRRAGLGLEIKPNENAINQERRETTSTPDHNFPVVGRDDNKRSVKYAMNPYLDERADGSSSSTNQEKSILSRLLYIGMNWARENILERLVQHNDNKNNNRSPMLSILPIVGIGGLGKTTLARIIFNDSDIKRNYDLRVWICVSDNFDKKTILKKIIHSIDSSNNHTSLENLEQELKKAVQGKHLFLVLDDIWCVDIGLWESFLNPLKEACNNSRGINILITTRLTNIAKVISGCMEPFLLLGLEDEDMHKLVMFHAFHNCNTVDDNTRQILETIGKDIVPRLKGSPLAAKTIGRLLASKHTTEHWTKILKSDLHTLEQAEDDIIPILRLSYQHLPGYLKQCLIYFSLFSKDDTFRKWVIVDMWMANNCICHTANRDVEDVGNEYFDFLVERSFVELCDEEDSDDDEDAYLMHDLIHDLIQSVSKYDCYWQYNNKKESGIKIPSSMRHANFYSSVSHFPNYKKLRTLFIDTKSVNLVELMDIRSMSCLRFLFVDGECPEELLECICNLKHLRVLYLSDEETIAFPESLGRLQNMQALLTDVGRLPETVTRLVNLRHLICKPKTISHIHGIGKLSRLQDLPLFCVKKKEGFHISQLKDMNMLHGKLEIGGLQLVKSKEEAEQAFLNKKVHLRELEINWLKDDSENDSEDHTNDDSDNDLEDEREKAIAEEVLEGLKPCSHLKIISIFNYVGGKLPSWMTASCLSSLECIELEGCPGIISLPIAICKMQFLKKLNVKNMPCLKEMEWPLDDSNCLDGDSLFTVLEELCLINLPQWEGWWITGEDEEIGSKKEYKNLRSSTNVLPHLKKLTLERCPTPRCFIVRALVLESLTLENCGTMKKLSVNFGNLMFLKSISIKNMWSLKYMKWHGDEDSLFPVLEELYLEYLPQWVGWWIEAENEEEGPQLEYRNHRRETSVLPRLKKLTLKSCPEATRFAARAPVLETLELCYVPLSAHDELLGNDSLPHLRDLIINGIQDLTSLHLLPALPALKKLDISFCPNLTACLLPPAPALQSLEIYRCDRISCLKWKPQHPHLPDEDSPFPLLEKLFLSNLPEWVGWWAEAENEEEEYQKRRSTLSRLKHLQIEHCPKTTRFAVRAPTLELLDLGGVPASLLVDVQVVSSLETPSVNTHHHQSQKGILRLLSIRHIQDLTSLNIAATLPCPVALGIYSCPNLTSCLLPPAPVALESLIISNCARISSIGSIANHQEPSPVPPKVSEISSALPSSHALSIERLQITDCPQLGMAPRTTSSLPSLSTRLILSKSLIVHGCHNKQLLRLLRGLDTVNLKELKVVDCEDMEHFDDDYDGEQHLSRLQSLPPNIFQKLVSLEKIQLACCPLLSSLPGLGLLTSLLSLKITDCPEVKDLPGVIHLTSLKELTIGNCPELTKKYSKRVDDKGNNINPHWNNISHIRQVWLR